MTRIGPLPHQPHEEPHHKPEVHKVKKSEAKEAHIPKSKRLKTRMEKEIALRMEITPQLPKMEPPK